jgi:hypothetical protein
MILAPRGEKPHEWQDMSRRFAQLGRLVLPLFLLAPAALAGQAEPTNGCRTGTVDHIFIDNHSIFDTSDPTLDPRFRWAYNLANRLHVRTRPEVIGRELLFDVGDCFDPVLVDESARLLRSYPFLSKVDIYGIQQPGGGYHVIVDTEDEWSTQVEAKLNFSGGFRLEGVDVRERNLLGTGRELGVFYRSLDATHEYGIGYREPQLLGSRWAADLAVGKTRAGSLFQQELGHPFVGEIGRWSMRQLLHYWDRHFDYVLPPADGLPNQRILVPMNERGFHLLGFRRFGRPGNLTVLGGGISMLEVHYDAAEDRGITLVQDGDFDARTPAPPELRAPAEERIDELRNVRAVLVIGKRNIRWRQRRGLDSFRGGQDLRVGAEVELAVGRSLPGLHTDNDLAGTLDFYAAAGPPAAFFAARVRTDARRDYDALPDQFEMRDIFSEGEVMVYLRPGRFPSRTLLLRAAGAGGWHVRSPYQITLGGERSLRGWPEESMPGGRRVVLTIEDRWYAGWPFPDVADLGTSLFLDVGRIWPGESPYGADSGWRASVGGGLRINFPAGATNTLRVDMAFPMERGGSLGRMQVLIGVGEYLGVTTPFSDPQFNRSRILPITGSSLDRNR